MHEGTCKIPLGVMRSPMLKFWPLRQELYIYGAVHIHIPFKRKILYVTEKLQDIYRSLQLILD